MSTTQVRRYDRDPALPTVVMGGGLRLGAIDGTVTRMPDTAANRAAFRHKARYLLGVRPHTRGVRRSGEPQNCETRGVR